jgi:protein-disulfide isomerase
MHKIWLILAAFCVLAPASLASAAEAPAITPEDHVLGKDDAPLTIIEYASPTCSHCAEFDRDTLPKIKQGWVDTGKAKLVFRIFPLNRIDVRVAMVASCIPPDRYFGFIHELYQSQDTWARGSDPVQAVANFGRLAGAGDAKIKSCLADSALENTIVSEAYAAQKAYGVESTPTFFINGNKMNPNGAQPFEVFDQALTAAQPKG